MNEITHESNDKYIEWKRWDRLAFGVLKKEVAAAFQSEVRRAQIPDIRDVVEIGFGAGAFMAFAKRKNWRIVGIEANPHLVALAQRAGYSAMGPGQLAQLPDKSLDLIAAFDVLEHLTHDQIDELLHTAKSKLRPQGAFLARFPNGDSPIGLCNQNGDITHITAIGIQKITYFADLHGLRIVYAGPEAMPILCGHAKHMLHRLFAVPIMRFLDAIAGPIFFPGFGVSLFSRNLVVVLKNKFD